MSTNAPHYYQRQTHNLPTVSIECAVDEHHDCVQVLSCQCSCHDQQMTYQRPTFLERNGQAITAIIGAAVFGFALALVVMSAVLR